MYVSQDQLICIIRPTTLTLNVFSMFSRVDGYLMSLQKRLTSVSSANRASCRLLFSAICTNRRKERDMNIKNSSDRHDKHTRAAFNRATLSSGYLFPSFLFFSTFFRFRASSSEQRREEFFFSFGRFFLSFHVASPQNDMEQQQRSRFILL
jgi:hypothetical protein